MIFNEAVTEGVRRGFESALVAACEGKDDPDSRCPMRPQDGCACYYRAYKSAPWWKRWWMEKPIRPSQDEVLTALLHQRIEQFICQKDPTP